MEKVPNNMGGRKEVSQKGATFPGSPASRECGQRVLLSPSITVQV